MSHFTEDELIGPLEKQLTGQFADIESGQVKLVYITRDDFNTIREALAMCREYFKVPVDYKAKAVQFKIDNALNVKTI